MKSNRRCESCEDAAEEHGSLCRRCRAELEIAELETEDAAMCALVDALRARGIKVPCGSGAFTRVLLDALNELPVETNWKTWAETDGVAAIEKTIRITE